jgi:hypothetical protein
MLKRLAVLLGAMLCALFMGCSNMSSFELTAKTDVQTVAKGEYFEIIVYTKNTGAPYSYRGSSTKVGAEAALYIETSDGRRNLTAMPIAVTSDYRHVTIKRNEVITTTWTFYVEENAPQGEYTLSLSFQETKVEIPQFITVE